MEETTQQFIKRLTSLGILGADEATQSKALSVTQQPQVGISDAEIEQLRTQGYREGDTVPGRGRLLPDGTFAQDAGSVTPGGLGLGRTFVGGKTQDELDLEKSLKDRANIVVDEEKIRRQTERLFQKEIDALNEVYAVQRAEARQRGLGRLGSDTAIQARRGLIGSSFGEAQTGAVEGKNKEELRAVDAERNAKISNILGQMRKSQVDEIERRRKAATEGADSLVDYYKGKLDRTNSAAQSAIAAMVAVGDVTDDELQQAADSLGVDINTLKSQYQTALKDKQTKDKKTELDTKKVQSELETEALNRAKTGQDMRKPYEVGGYIYEYDPLSGVAKKTGKSRSVSEDSETTGNYDAKTIPQEVKADILTTIQENPKATFQDLVGVFPEVKTDYLQDLLDSLK